jgi:hypothetical protein
MLTVALARPPITQQEGNKYELTVTGLANYQTKR